MACRTQQRSKTNSDEFTDRIMNQSIVTKMTCRQQRDGVDAHFLLLPGSTTSFIRITRPLVVSSPRLKSQARNKLLLK